MAGASVLTLANGYALLVVGRFGVGVGVGIASAVVPVYICEVAPMHQRGRLTVINTVCVSSGQLIANVVDALLGNVTQGWRYMFAVSALPAMVQFVGFFFLPESPRYLLSRGRKAEARAVLESVRRKGYPIDLEMKQIEAASQAKQGGLRELLSHAHLRRILFMAMMMQAINQLVGINTIMVRCVTCRVSPRTRKAPKLAWSNAARSPPLPPPPVLSLPSSPLPFGLCPAAPHKQQHGAKAAPLLIVACTACVVLQRNDPEAGGHQQQRGGHVDCGRHQRCLCRLHRHRDAAHGAGWPSHADAVLAGVPCNQHRRAGASVLARRQLFPALDQHRHRHPGVSD